MQAYLLIGTNNLQPATDNLAKKLKAKILEFPIAKIEDTRNLNNLIRLSFDEPTLIVIPNIHEATEEALNAFLKNLEEPQENIYFALTAPSVKRVLPTIVSRCQIIRTINNQQSTINNEEIDKFLTMKTEQKLAFFDKMSRTPPAGVRVRSEACEFVESLIFNLHAKRDLRNMEILLQTLARLKANGNVSLQLTNLVIKYV